VYLCRAADRPQGVGAVYPAREVLR
jgi:hypothetical protein